jgi:hypothetical protein
MSEQFKVGDDVIVVNDHHVWLGCHDLDRDTVLKVVAEHGEENHFVDAVNLLIEIKALNIHPEDFKLVSKCTTGPTENTEVNIEVKVGDTVEVLETLLAFSKDGPTEVGTVLKVVEEKPGDWWVHGGTIEIGAFEKFRSKFKLVPSTTRYTTGGAIGQHNVGLIGEQACETIIPLTRIVNEATVRADNNQSVTDVINKVREDIKTACENAEPKILGMFRPVLETRKVGKVRVELVDKGFPNTLWALAELLTWAQEAKGYEDHDWANIPNALEALPAAASRHRMKHNKGEKFDDESGKLHKLHELFGLMAECELLLKDIK